MGEARRRANKGLPPRKSSANQKISSAQILPWLPITVDQREQFFRITKIGAWLGIGLLIVFWIVVRFVGPAAGWWVPFDAR